MPSEARTAHSRGPAMPEPATAIKPPRLAPLAFLAPGASPPQGKPPAMPAPPPANCPPRRKPSKLARAWLCSLARLTMQPKGLCHAPA
jgi:hypothetical protein